MKKVVERKASEGNHLVWLLHSLSFSVSFLGFELSHLKAASRLGGHLLNLLIFLWRSKISFGTSHPRPLMAPGSLFVSGFLGYLFQISVHFGKQILWEQRAFFGWRFCFFKVAGGKSCKLLSSTLKWIYFDTGCTSFVSCAKSLLFCTSQFPICKIQCLSDIAMKINWDIGYVVASEFSKCYTSVLGIFTQ